MCCVSIDKLLCHQITRPDMVKISRLRIFSSKCQISHLHPLLLPLPRLSLLLLPLRLIHLLRLSLLLHLLLLHLLLQLLLLQLLHFLPYRHHWSCHLQSLLFLFRHQRLLPEMIKKQMSNIYDSGQKHYTQTFFSICSYLHNISAMLMIINYNIEHSF